MFNLASLPLAPAIGAAPAILSKAGATSAHPAALVSRFGASGKTMLPVTFLAVGTRAHRRGECPRLVQPPHRPYA